MLMEMVHASATRYLWQAALVFSATNLPTCPQHNGTMLFQHYLAGSFLFFACVGFGPTFKESVFALLANSGNSAELLSHFFFFFGLEKLVTNSIF